MLDAPAPSSRRRLIVVLSIGVLIIAAVVGATLLKQSGEPVRSAASLCARLDQAKNLDNALTSLDPTTLAPQVRALIGAGPVAPKEIEPQISTLSKFVDSLLQEVDDAPPSDRRKVLADILARRQDEIDGVSSAGRAVQNWAAANCGLALGNSTSSVTP